MLWILKRNIFSEGATAIFNALNGNSNANSSNSRNSDKSTVSKNVAYNKLASNDEFSLNEDSGNPSSRKSSRFSYFSDGGDNYDYEDDLTDDSDYDESLTCNVCDRSFYSRRTLEQHQQKKRHFGCSACDTLFTSIMQLEHHKEEFEHWSDSETSALTNHHNCEDDDDFYDGDSYVESGEEMERLL